MAPDFQPLQTLLSRAPSVAGPIGCGELPDDGWWVKFAIKIDHPLAWRTVQELGHVLNYVSLEDRLPTVFMPVSPPPYMNGGPEDFLSWVIETRSAAFSPQDCARWIEGRLPRPIDDEAQWRLETSK